MIVVNGRSPRHRQQRSKNLTLLAILLGVALLIFFTSIVRMSSGE